MIEDIKDITNLFRTIASSAPTGGRAFMIGGGAMMVHGLKAFTKDIDLVTIDMDSYMTMMDTLKAIGFIPQLPESGYERLQISNIMVMGDYRIDLFMDKVCGRFSYSDGMANRSEPFVESNGWSFLVCSPSDIFLFKTLTEREGDFDDCISLLHSPLMDWGTVMDEMMDQIDHGEELWITWIEDSLLKLKDAGKRIPIMDEVSKMSEDYIDRWMDEMEKAHLELKDP